MAEVLSYCGYRCDQCPAFRKNLRTPEDRKKVAEGWEKYYDYRIKPEKVDCDGCSAAQEAPNPSCEVRPCAIDRSLRHCAECDDFVCDKLMKQMRAIRWIADSHGPTMPAEDYQRYIAPYESEERLHKLRRGG